MAFSVPTAFVVLCLYNEPVSYEPILCRINVKHISIWRCCGGQGVLLVIVSASLGNRCCMLLLAFVVVALVAVVISNVAAVVVIVFEGTPYSTSRLRLLCAREIQIRRQQAIEDYQDTRKV